MKAFAQAERFVSEVSAKKLRPSPGGIALIGPMLTSLIV